MEEAIAREKRIKNQTGQKLALIAEMNPDWANLYEMLNI